MCDRVHVLIVYINNQQFRFTRFRNGRGTCVINHACISIATSQWAEELDLIIDLKSCQRSLASVVGLAIFWEMVDLSEEEIERLYAWIDEVPLSRHKKNLARDFSDGGKVFWQCECSIACIYEPLQVMNSCFWFVVLAAEVVNHYFPKIVDLHNYSPANSTNQKLENWRTLNRECNIVLYSIVLLPAGKVFAKFYFNVPDHFLQSIATCKPGIVEYVLNHLKTKVCDIHS